MAKLYKNPGPISYTAIIQRNADLSNSSAWIEGAKKPETRQRRIAKMCEMLK
jgi:hypothetical protein